MINRQRAAACGRGRVGLQRSILMCTAVGGRRIKTRCSSESLRTWTRVARAAMDLESSPAMSEAERSRARGEHGGAHVIGRQIVPLRGRVGDACARGAHVIGRQIVPVRGRVGGACASERRLKAARDAAAHRPPPALDVHRQRRRREERRRARARGHTGTQHAARVPGTARRECDPPPASLRRHRTRWCKRARLAGRGAAAARIQRRVHLDTYSAKQHVDLSDEAARGVEAHHVICGGDGGGYRE